MDIKRKDALTRAEKSWITYDVASSAFTMITSVTIPLAFGLLMTQAGLSSEAQAAAAGTFGTWGLATSISVLILAVLSPLLGTLADYEGMKKRLWLVSLLLGLAGGLCLVFVNSWVGFLAVFVATRIGYSAANMFYDAMLTDVTTDKRMDRVSTSGYAWGYIGSCVPFIVCIVFVVLGSRLGELRAYRLGFLVTVLWWALWSIPTLKNVKQVHFIPRGGAPLRPGQVFRQLKGTFQKICRDKALLFFILAYFFYIDGVYTIISMAVAYGDALHLSSISMVLALLVTQFVAFPCAILSGRLSRRFGPRRLIRVFILMYIAISLFGAVLTQEWQFWVLAVAVGMCQGGIQALSRSCFGQMIPKEESNEYFGFFDIFGKLADFFGPMIIFVCCLLFPRLDGAGVVIGNRVGIAALTLLFLLGFLLLCRSDRLLKARK